MSLFTRFGALLSLGFLGLLYSGIATAGDAVVIPLYSPNLNAQKIGNITSLITSQVDFAGRYDMVSQADLRPKSLTPKCLKSISCLKAIAIKEGTTAMIAGSVIKKGNMLEFYVVMYENAKIIRLGDFKIEDNPLSVADSMGVPIQELITGRVAPKEEEEVSGRAINANDFLEEEEDIFSGAGEESLDDFSLDENTAAEKASAKRKAEEAKRLAAKQARAKEQAKMEAEAARLSQENQKEEDFDFDFAPSTIEVVAEGKKSTTSSSSMTDEGEVSLNLDSEPDFERPKERDPVDFESSRSKTSRSKTKKKPAGDKSHIQATASIMGKVGASNFQGMSFVTYGGEIGVHLSDWVALTIAGEGYATQQETPILDDNGIPTDELIQQWRVILPLGVGVLAHFPGKIAKPYAGAELQIIPSYVETGSGMAYGLRGRAGSNFMLTDNFGFNLNLAAGFWSGQQFTYIEDQETGSPLLSTGFLPQLSVGTLITF